MVKDVDRFATALADASPRQGRIERLVRVLFAAWCRICGWRIDVTLVAPLPQRQSEAPGAGCLVVPAPHRTWLEPFLLVAAWPRGAARLVWLADGRTVRRSRLHRWLLPRLGVIPIVGGIGSPRVYAELAHAVLDRGCALVVFPEVGPPSSQDRTRKISPGFAYLARRAGAPIVPVVIGGTHHIVRGSSFTIDVLAAIDVGGSEADPFTTEGRDDAHSLADRYREGAEALLQERNAVTDSRRPPRDSWTWLATLLD